MEMETEMEMECKLTRNAVVARGTSALKVAVPLYSAIVLGKQDLLFCISAHFH